MTARNFWLALGLLGAGLSLTMFAALYLKDSVEATSQRDFEFASGDVQLNITRRLTESAQLLLSGAAFMDVSGTVTRQEWQAFAAKLQLEQQLPGIQGFGFAELIPPEQLAEHIQEIRTAGYPDYQVKPEGEREIYSAIIYLEPFSGRNLRAFGYDMLSEPVRRVAMERARDLARPALSGKVVLVQEDGQDVQGGALMYMPVYQKGLPVETVAQRRAAIRGWVYSPYRMTDLMRGTLGGWELKQKDRPMTLQIYDGAEISAETLLYDSQATSEQAQAGSAQVIHQSTVDFGGHRWTLRFSQVGGLVVPARYTIVWLVLVGGVLLSLVFFWLALSLLGSRDQARRMAERLTADLQESETRYREIFEQGQLAKLLIDPISGRILEANPAAARFYGYPRDILELLSITEIHQLAPAEVIIAMQLAMTQKRSYFNFAHRLASGEVRQVEVHSSPISLRGQRLLLSTVNDITERKLVEQERNESEIRFRRLFETAKDGILILDAQTGRILDVNPFLVDLLGYTVEQFHEKEIWGIGLFKDILANQDKFLELQQKKYVRYEDLPLETAHGKTIHVEFVSNVYLVDHKKVIQCNIRDMTAHHEAEKKIQVLNSALEQLAGTDGLTGVNNHRALLILAEHEMDIALRYTPPLAMLFFDIDHFKQVNDTFGHAMGDRALIRTIQTVCNDLRSTDLIGRYGGDEFVVLLPQTSALEAQPLAQRIQTSIAEMVVDTDRGPLRLTISIGIAQSIHLAGSGPVDTVEALLLRADQALYAAKRAGRSCTVLYGHFPDPQTAS